MHDPDPQTAVLLIAHGSKRQEANDDLLRLAELVTQRGSFHIVEVSYLDVVEPTIPMGARQCINRGARQVLMLPYFLSAGMHVVHDMQTHRDDLAREFPDVEFVLCPHLGLHPLMADIVMQRLNERM